VIRGLFQKTELADSATLWLPLIRGA